ncbi:CHAD domain-containing protein [Microbulbifer magnicolonia]|uniref:CHAD domain-containing protein n=1 Tax=Microbulbifer magnicolonia TaxID=3109744 RepID=UPI002B408736|nr:CHAD domain-containing protein [Microbulbifer sp. GG15]
MAYRLKRKKSVADGLRDTAHREVSGALADLEELPEEEAVHELRKHCKKMRALLRLVRADIDDLYRYENAHYPTLANSLAGSRDAVSMRDAFLKLANQNRYPQILEFLKERAQGHRDPSALEDTRTLLQRGGERIDDWPVDHLKWKHARKGYKNYYRRAFKAMNTAFAEEDAASYHEFRKRVKDHWYHSRLLEKKYKDWAKPRRKPLKELAQALGDWRDLRLLCSLLSEHGDLFSGELIPLLDTANERLDELHLKIERLSRKLFKTRKFAFDAES